MPNRPEKLRQVIARYERLIEGASPEMAAVYAAEIAAVRGMLARIEAAAASTSKDAPNSRPDVKSEIDQQGTLKAERERRVDHTYHKRE